MRSIRRWSWYILALAALTAPRRLSAQSEDTTIWQPSGREIFAEWAQRNSVAAQALFRNLQGADYRFLTVAEYGLRPIGLWKPAHDSAWARYGARMYADSDQAGANLPDEYHNTPNLFAEYYNEALFNFVSAPDSARRCCLALATPFGDCGWTPLPPSSTAPLERSLVPVDEVTLEAMLDAALAAALAHTSRDSNTVAFDAAWGSDGGYNLARKGRHPAAWLRRLVEQHRVSCVLHSDDSPPCPATGPLTTITLDQPRFDEHREIVIHTGVITAIRQQGPQDSLPPGFAFGSMYDAYLVRDGAGYKAESRMELIMN